jgi:hypothetical protein
VRPLSNPHPAKGKRHEQCRVGAGPPEPRRERKINEDWAATIVGLVLLVLILLGLIPAWLVP